MNAFTFERLSRPADAASAVAARPGAMFLAGGTTLVDLMKVNVLTPDAVVDVRHLGLSSIDVSDRGDRQAPPFSTVASTPLHDRIRRSRRRPPT